MNIHLRTASLEDAPFLTDVVIKATLAQGRFSDDTDMDEYRAGYEEWSRETIAGQIPNCTLSVIEKDGIPIGRLRVIRETTSITLAGIQLLPAYQAQGVGRLLLNQLIHEAAEKNIPLQLSVEKDNPHAQRFYEQLGFLHIGEDEDEYHLEYHPRMSNI